MFSKKSKSANAVSYVYLVFGGILNGLANFYAFGQIFKWPKLNKPSVRRVTLIIVKKNALPIVKGSVMGVGDF